MNKKKMFLTSIAMTFALGLGLVTLAGCSLVDIRPQGLIQSGVTAENTQKGRALVDALEDKHGGLERWRAYEVSEVVFTDSWPSPVLAHLGSSWPDQHQRMLDTMLLGQDTSRVVMLGGENDGEVRGIQNWVTYHQLPGKNLEFAEDKSMFFTLPTLQYFLEAPFRLHEAEIVVWVGEVKFEGRRYDKVFLSWGSDEPQDSTDQYIAWIDKETGLLSFLEFTVRDQAPFIKAAIAYEGYETAQGLTMARTLRVVDQMGSEDILHVMLVEELRYGVEVPVEVLFPDPSRRGGKF